jgi:hypothetical protein
MSSPSFPPFVPLEGDLRLAERLARRGDGSALRFACNGCDALLPVEELFAFCYCATCSAVDIACESCGTTAYESSIFARDEGIVDPVCCEPERSLENIFPRGLDNGSK